MKDTQIWLVLYGIIWKCFGPVYSFTLKLLKRTNHFENLENNEKGYKMLIEERGCKQKWKRCKLMKGVTNKNGINANGWKGLQTKIEWQKDENSDIKSQWQADNNKSEL